MKFTPTHCLHTRGNKCTQETVNVNIHVLNAGKQFSLSRTNNIGMVLQTSEHLKVVLRNSCTCMPCCAITWHWGLQRKVTWSSQADCRLLISVSSAPPLLLANSVWRARVPQEGLFMFSHQNLVFLIKKKQKTKIQQASVVFKIALITLSGSKHQTTAAVPASVAQALGQGLSLCK